MTAIRDYLMRMEGMEANVEGRPSEKQWATIVQWLSELRKSTEDRPSETIVRPTNAVMVEAGLSPQPVAVSDMLEQINAIKRNGAAGSGFQAGASGGQAMDAAPPAAMIKRK